MRGIHAAHAPALREVRRFPVAVLLGALMLLIVAAPLLDESLGASWIEPLLLSAILVSAVMAVGARRATLVALSILVIPALVARWVSHFWPDLMPPEAFLVAGIVFIAAVIGLLLRFILCVQRVDSEVLCVGVVIFLLLGLLWTLAYLLVASAVPNSFTFGSSPPGTTMDSFNALYFSFSTLSTVGFGDIVPSSRIARMLAVMESTTGMIYPAIVIARLVSLYSSAPPGDQPAER